MDLEWIPGANNEHCKGREVDSYMSGELTGVLEPDDEPLSPEEIEFLAAEDSVESESEEEEPALVMWGYGGEDETKGDDGEWEEDEDEDEVEAEKAPRWPVGSAVCFDWKGLGDWYTAKVAEANSDGSYLIDYGWASEKVPACKAHLIKGADDWNVCGGRLIARKQEKEVEKEAHVERRDNPETWERISRILVDLRALGIAPGLLVHPHRRLVEGLATAKIQAVFRGSATRRKLARRAAKEMRTELERLVKELALRRVREELSRLTDDGAKTSWMLRKLRERERRRRTEPWELACARARYLLRTSVSMTEFHDRLRGEPTRVKSAWYKAGV